MRKRKNPVRIARRKGVMVSPGYFRTVAEFVHPNPVRAKLLAAEQTLQLRFSGEFNRFVDEELRAVLRLLAGSTLR